MEEDRLALLQATPEGPPRWKRVSAAALVCVATVFAASTRLSAERSPVAGGLAELLQTASKGRSDASDDDVFSTARERWAGDDDGSSSSTSSKRAKAAADDDDDDDDDPSAPHYCADDDFLTSAPINCIPRAGNVGACEWCQINCGADDDADDADKVDKMKTKTCHWCNKECYTPYTYSPTAAATVSRAPTFSFRPTLAPLPEPTQWPTLRRCCSTPRAG